MVRTRNATAPKADSNPPARSRSVQKAPAAQKKANAAKNKKEEEKKSVAQKKKVEEEKKAKGKAASNKVGKGQKAEPVKKAQADQPKRGRQSDPPQLPAKRTRGASTTADAPAKKAKTDSVPPKQKQTPAKPTPAAKPTAAKKTSAKAKPARSPSPSPEPEKVVKQIRKGSAAVDSVCPRAKHTHVYEEPGKIWTATLNQSNLKQNNNKFYIIQLLQDDEEKDKFYIWNRWGRVGFQGQFAIFGWMTCEKAKQQYNKKFADKTRGGYVPLEIVYTEEDEPKPVKKTPKKKANIPASTLDSRVQNFIQLIFDLKQINRTLAEIGYDSRKMPLGKLSTNNLRQGYEILREIEQVITRQSKGDLSELSSRFYTIIPHDFGFQHMSNFIINTTAKLKDKVDMIDALSDMKIATNFLSKDVEDTNEVDVHYGQLNCNIKPIDKSSRLYKLLEQYVQNTHATTHRGYDLTVMDIFEVDRNGEDKKFKKNIGNNMLLWHGSRLTNWVGILSQGLRIAPPEAPVSGYMFGKGVYFADMVSKSANYCFTNRDNNTGVLLLCEVALGEPNELFFSDYNAGNLPPGKHSTKGCGKTAPPASTYVDIDGVTAPIGKGAATNVNGSLLYNEYIVYDVDQIKMKYLFKMRFDYKF